MSELFHRDGRPFPGQPLGGDKPYAMVTLPCHRCSGIGRFEHWRHVEGGICFECNGTRLGRTVRQPLYTADRLAALNATQAKRRAKQAAECQAKAEAAQAAADAKRAAFEDANRDMLAWLETVAVQDGYFADGQPAYRDGFLGDMLMRAREHAEWTEAQSTALAASYARAVEREALRRKSRHVGTPGERIELRAVVERESSFYRQRFGFGQGDEEVFVTTLRTPAGHALVVKSPAFRAPVGSTLHLRGTVKDHTEYRDEAQTLLVRVKVLSETAAEAV